MFNANRIMLPAAASALKSPTKQSHSPPTNAAAATAKTSDGGRPRTGSNSSSAANTAAAATPLSPSNSGGGQYKFFLSAQIRDKIAKRKNSMPEYEALLMAAAVPAGTAGFESRTDGITFDTFHPSWTLLIKRAAEIDKKHKSAATTAAAGGNSNSAVAAAIAVAAGAVAASSSPAIASSTVDDGGSGSNGAGGSGGGGSAGNGSQPVSEWVNIESVGTTGTSTTSTSAASTTATTGESNTIAGMSYSFHAPKPFKQQPIVHARSSSTSSGGGDSSPSSNGPPAAATNSKKRSGGKASSTAPAAATTAAVAPPTAEERAALLVVIDRELAADVPDRIVLTSALRKIGVPTDRRARVWQYLLNCRPPPPASGDDDAASDNKQQPKKTAVRSTSSVMRDQQLATAIAHVNAPPELVPEQPQPAAADGAQAAAPAASTTATGAATAGAGAAAGVRLDLKNQRVIKADINRTLTHVPEFLDEHIKLDMEVILTEYCKSEELGYKQGMNYVLAPFMLLGLQSRGEIYALYRTFINRLLHNTFTDHEFGGLQCVFAVFRFLLLYHDPALCAHLDESSMGPELYASSWFITLYANKIMKTKTTLLYLWDLLLLEQTSDPLLHYFVSLALLCSQRDLLMSETEVTLPETLNKIMINEPEEAALLVAKAKKYYRARTPQSILDQLYSVTSRKISVDSPEYHDLLNRPCLSIRADELIRHCYHRSNASAADSKSKAAPPSGLHFFVLDCRPATQFEAGHIACALHLDPELLRAPMRRPTPAAVPPGGAATVVTAGPAVDELAAKLSSYASMKGQHFVLIGGTSADNSGSGAGAGAGTARGQQQAPNADTVNLLKHFIRSGFKYVSYCEGGYSTVHALVALDSTIELADHNPKNCLECNPPAPKPGAKKPKSSDAKRASGGASKSNAGSSAAPPTASDGPFGFMSSLTKGVQKMVEFASDVTADLKSSVSSPSNSPVTPSPAALALAARNHTLPSAGMVVPHSATMHLLHTMLRDRAVSGKRLQDCVNRLAAILISTLLDMARITNPATGNAAASAGGGGTHIVAGRECSVMTASGSVFTGLELTTSLLLVSLSRPHSELALAEAIAPFAPLIRFEFARLKSDANSTAPTTHLPIGTGRTKPESKTPVKLTASTAAPPASPLTASLSDFVGASDSAATSTAGSKPIRVSMNRAGTAPAAASTGTAASTTAVADAATAALHARNTTVFESLPVDGLAQRTVLVFVPVLTAGTSMDELTVAVDELIKCGVRASRIVVLALVGARPAIWSLSDRYSRLGGIIVTACDELKQQKNAKSPPLLLPGVPTESIETRCGVAAAAAAFAVPATAATAAAAAAAAASTRLE